MGAHRLCVAQKYHRFQNFHAAPLAKKCQSFLSISLMAQARLTFRFILFNPDFAIGRGIRRRRPDFFFLKKFVRCPRIDLTFFIEKAAAFFVSVLAPIAKSGFNSDT
jgi:hypothetical protein